MSTVNIKKRVIDELASSPVPLTRADIYQAIKQQVNVETKQVNNAVDNLTRQGFIDKGPSEYKNGAAVLTYKLTDKGVEYASPVEAVDQLDQVADLPIKTHGPEFIEDLKNDGSDGLENVHLSDSAIETLVRDGYMVLDPMSESDQFICEVVNRLKTPCPQIKNKAEKIGVLNLMRDHYGYINTDFGTVLSDIIQDLKQLEEAA